ncbi:hypothetical protein MPTK1_5g08970 [Marchantia polymorpha subsp. ruderalis]|uniref:FAS1 domain-containing protein n=2 Tax=Marchantia polymorpha TaxID=3197 RepID=A0AAF6BGF8_MARPO|nr:hypothetical protein MARPO_0095s0061 [Marchantia polymorpha]BBN11092.1 hypothetical protein Mp_5g08970 [Marchantia polymorpha subsp. ruderalis]|eukprot:PTQ32805.1 hypothetical protein MARPO_0095s0061 [Marchantia polymorpha]
MGVRSPGVVVVRTMTIKRPSPKQFRAGRDGVQLGIYLVAFVLVGLVKIDAVEAQVVPSPSPLRAPAPSAIPPPPPLTALQQSQAAVQALRANNFTTAAQLIQTYLPILRLNSTLFVPTNEALSSLSMVTPVLNILLYHAATPQYTFDQLVTLPVGTRLQSFLANESVLITNNARNNFQVDNVRIVLANVCASNTTDLQISCHGVESILNSTLYGNSAPAPVSSSPVAAPVPAFTPAASPPVPFILPGPPAVPSGSPESSIPIAASPTESSPTGGASACRVRRILYIVFLGVMTLSYNL